LYSARVPEELNNFEVFQRIYREAVAANSPGLPGRSAATLGSSYYNGRNPNGVAKTFPATYPT